MTPYFIPILQIDPVQAFFAAEGQCLSIYIQNSESYTVDLKGTPFPVLNESSEAAETNQSRQPATSVHLAYSNHLSLWFFT
jgi:hypothetical protein